MQRLIFHVDVNSAFLSWEAARRVADGESDLRLIPSAIGGDRDKRTGVILAKSIPAKKFGVTTGEPVAMALRKCPQLVLAKPDFALYTRNSKAFIAICRRFAPVVEQVSDGYTPLRLLGVTLGDVSDNETAQLSMFQDDQKDRARKLDQTVDQLRSKFGVSAISRGSVTDATKRVGRKYKAQLDDRNKK